MKRAILAGMLLLAFCLMVSAQARAQLVMTEQKMKIVKVEREFNRLQCRVHEVNKGNVQYVLVDGDTKFSTKDRPVSFDEAWKYFKPDMIIRVKGGMTITGKIKAKTVLW